MIEIERLNDGVHVVCPYLRVVVGVARFIGRTVTSHIHCDESVIVGKGRVHLPAPLKRALRDTMNEDDWTAVWVSGLDNMQLNAATACDLVGLRRRSSSRRPADSTLAIRSA